MSSRARIALVIAVLLFVMTVGLYAFVNGHGFDARGTPGALETAVALRLRASAIPSDARKRTNPEPLSEENFRTGLAHFADHCSTCHGNDGAGDTDFGRGLYPKPPDMRLARTQNLTDGELFYIIEHGVPLTGMPGFGTEGGVALAHANHKVMGTVTMVAADHVMLKDKGGKEHTIKLAKTTKVTRNKKAMKAADIKVGTRIVVTAVSDSDLTAKIIEVGAAPAIKK